MMRFIDAIVLAHTKLRVHKVRTAFAIIIPGLLFGLLLAVIFITQGVFDSLGRFSKEGLNDRAIVNVMQFDEPVQLYSLVKNKEFIKEVEQIHAKRTAEKQVAAQKHNIPYAPLTQDPSPVQVDEETGEKYIDQDDTGHASVVAAADARRKPSTFDIDELLKKYSSATVLSGNKSLSSVPSGAVELMKGGREYTLSEEEAQESEWRSFYRLLAVMNQSMADAFIAEDVSFDSAKGELPMIVPFSDAEKLLGLEPLEGNASTQEKYKRLQEVRERANEVTASFCYRNAASKALFAQALSQHKDEEKNKGKEGYQEPRLRYALPANDSCGAVTVASDTRTAQEKDFTERYTAYEKEIGAYIGEPEQHKLTLRAVGITGNSPSATMGAFSVEGMVQDMLGSWLGYDTWVIPSEMLQQLPEASRPDSIFEGAWGSESRDAMRHITNAAGTYYVEFGDVLEARAFLEAHGGTIGSASKFFSGRMMVASFGSSMLVVEDLKDIFNRVLLWTLLIIGGVSVIILGSVIGRTVSEGRRESAVFRAIGARRADIGGIYGVYAFLLAVRIMVCAIIIGFAVAVGVELWLSESATLGARYAYLAPETGPSFHFIGLISPYVPVVLGGIIVFGMIASVIPVLRSARRNPINDMRDDT